MSSIKYTVIFSGGVLDEETALGVIDKREEVFIIGVDSGVEFLYDHQISPDYLVGDFDSLKGEVYDYYRNKTKVPIQQHDPVKDATDTEIAIRLAMEIGYREIILLGATGGRIDHLWGNVQSLLTAFRKGFHAVIIDEYNRIRIIGGDTVLCKSEAYGPYFSFFTLNGPVAHFNIEGAKYPLSDHTLESSGSLCVSNEFRAEQVRVTFPKGDVVLMETRDRRK